jgi:hypothetical protein
LEERREEKDLLLVLLLVLDLDLALDWEAEDWCSNSMSAMLSPSLSDPEELLA